MFSIGSSEILILLLIVIIFLGPKRLPEIAKAIGKIAGSIKKTGQDFKEEMNRGINESAPDMIDRPSCAASEKEIEDFSKKTYGDIEEIDDGNQEKPKDN